MLAARSIALGRISAPSVQHLEASLGRGPALERPFSTLSPTMASTEAGGADVSLTIKGPNALKLTVQVTLDMTVLQLKQKIEEADKNFPVARCVCRARPDRSQRLIYSGKVLKDPETLESYKVQNGRTYRRYLQ